MLQLTVTTTLAIVGSVAATVVAFSIGNKLLPAMPIETQREINSIIGLLVFASPLLLLYVIITFIPNKYLHLKENFARNWIVIFAYGTFFLLDALKFDFQKGTIIVGIETDGSPLILYLLMAVAPFISIVMNGIIALVYRLYQRKASPAAIFLQSMGIGLVGAYGTVAIAKALLGIN